MSTGTKRGFTITELLVVITIIGVLVALSLPALNAGFMTVRRFQCQKKQKELATACTAYEAKRNELPKLRKVMANGSLAQWSFTLFPYLQEMETYKKGSMPSRTFSFLVCPSTPPSGVPDPISYVGNAGKSGTSAKGCDPSVSSMGDDNDTNKTNAYSVDSGFISKHDGVGNTLLLTESVRAKKFSDPSAEWTQGVIWPMGRSERFNQNLETKGGLGNARPSSYHQGGFVFAFCDSSTIFASENMNPAIFHNIMTPFGEKCGQNIPGATREELTD